MIGNDILLLSSTYFQSRWTCSSCNTNIAISTHLLAFRSLLNKSQGLSGTQNMKHFFTVFQCCFRYMKSHANRYRENSGNKQCDFDWAYCYLFFLFLALCLQDELIIQSIAQVINSPWIDNEVMTRTATSSGRVPLLLGNGQLMQFLQTQIFLGWISACHPSIKDPAVEHGRWISFPSHLAWI